MPGSVCEVVQIWQLHCRSDWRMEMMSVFLDQQRTLKKLRGDFLLSLMQDEESRLKSEENAICHSQFCSDLKATDTIPPAHTHTMLVWIPKLASSQSRIYHCFAQLFDFLCRDGGGGGLKGRTSIGPPCTQTHHPIKNILQCTLVFGSYVQGQVVGHSFLQNDKLRRITETHKGLDPSSSVHELPAADLKSLTQLTAFISPLRSNCTASCDLQISQNAFFWFLSQLSSHQSFLTVLCQLWPSNSPKSFWSGFLWNCNETPAHMLCASCTLCQDPGIPREPAISCLGLSS
jgi:hypothetical protein